MVERKYHVCHNKGCINSTPNPRLGSNGYEIHYKNCDVCSKLKSNYGITTPERDAMGDSVNWECVICNSRMRKVEQGDKSRTIRDAVVDHCHDTGKVRGLICAQCNRGLGYFNDNYETLKRAKEYLK
jgi:hypothetical protein